MEKEPDAECGSSASCMSAGKSKLDTLAKDDLIKFAKKQMAAMQKLKSKCAGLEEKVEALKANPGGTSDDSVIQELTERMDAVLLEKAETQQMLVLLRKENETLKNQREESVEKVAALQEKLHHVEMDHTEKIKHLEEQFKISETKYREELQAFKKLASENEEIQRHRLQEDFNANIEAVRQEYEHKIFDLEQNLELTKKELKTENEGLQETHHITLQIKQGEIENLQETISKLSKQHEDEVSYLEEQLEISAADFDMERERLLLVQEELSEQIALKESYLQDVQEEEEDLNRRTQKPSESMEALDSPDPENEMDRLRLAVQDLQSQNTMLKEELTFLTNVKAALEGDLKHLKEEFSMEREELEFKINELQMTKEEGETCPEKEPEDVTTAKETISLEEHNQILQGLKESHTTEMKELEAYLASSSEREKEVIAQEAQDLQNKCKVLSEEKNAVVDEYEHTKEILRNIELELGDRTSEFVKKYNAMKEQATVSVQELEEKLREKDSLIEKLECTQKEMQESSEQKPQREENIAPEGKDVHVVMMSDTENLVTLKDIVMYMEKIQEECKHAGVDTARVTLEKLKDLSGVLQGALDETKCLRSSEAEWESRLSHEKEQLAKDLALSNEEKAELQREHQSASHERDALRKDLEISEEKLSEARKQVCSVLAQNYSVIVHEDKDISTLLEHLLSRVQEEKSTRIVLDVEKAKLEKDLGALSEERHDLKKVLEDSDRKLSETQKRVCEILEQHFSVNTVSEEDITVLLNHLLSSIHEEKKSYMMLNEEKIKLQGDLMNMVEERDELRRCVETHEGKLSDARKRVCEILEQNYSVIMDEQQDLFVLLDHLLSRGQEDKSTCIVSNEEKLRKLEKDLQSLSVERNDLKKVLEDSGIKLSETQKHVCEILEQHFSVNTVGEEDITVLLNHLLSSIHEEKKSYMMLNEEKIKLQGDLMNMVEERDELRRCVETHEGKRSDARKRVCEILEQNYSVIMDEAEDISVLLDHLLSRGQEEKSTCIVSNEEKAKLEKDLQALSEERNDLKKVLEDGERELSDAQKRVREILEQHYAVNTVGEEDITVLLNHLLSSIHEEKKSYNEEKMKLQGDLVRHERNLSDARKSVCEILEQNYSVNMEEEQDLSVLLEHLLSRVQEEKLVLTQQLDGKAVQHQQAELIDAGFLQTTGRNEVLPDTVILQGDQNQQVEISGRSVSQEREEPAVEGGAQETDDMKSLQQKLSERESIVAHLKEELSLLQESKLSTLNENMRQIEILEKESKEKEERLNKFKAVAVKARKELDSSRKEASRLKEDLEALRAEKDKMSDSMKAIIHGAESYKNLMIDYDKQTELLDKEKEKLEASEKLVVDLNKRLHVAVEQHQQLSSEREDLMAHIETLQSNIRQLEAQALEMHKLKSTVERDLEAERLLKEQKTKEHVCAVKEVEELHSFLQKQKQHLQQTEQELEQLRKDAQQSTLLDMEMADYERLVKELNLQLSEKNRLLEEQERQTQAQREREEKLNQEIESLKSLVDVGEEKASKVKQLLVKAKKDLADAKKEEASQMIVQSSLKGELESIQQQLENYKIQSSELTADRHRLQEQLKALNDQHQKSVTSYQTQLTTLQNDLSTTKADLESIKSEYNSYKVRVHNVLKQQKNKSSTQSDGDFSKQERENMETILEQLRSKLQESQLNAQSCNAELQQLQTEYDTLLERHNKMLQQTIAKEAELRERLLSLNSENVALKSEHSQSVAQLTAQTEALRSSFREQLHHLQDEHRSTVETLQHQINSLESQLFQLQKEPATSAAQQPSKKPHSDRKLADLPLFEMNMAREEGEGMETTESESLSTAGTPPPSLEQLLTSPDPKHEPFVWQVEPTKEELTNKLSTATRSMEHMNSLLHESEATNAILMEQISLLKSEMRRLERNQEREKSVANLEYLKNVLLQFIFLRAGSEKQALLPVIHTMLQLSPEEKSKLSAIAQGEEEAAASRGSGWTSYLHSWSGIR